MVFEFEEDFSSLSMILFFNSSIKNIQSFNFYDSVEVNIENSFTGKGPIESIYLEKNIKLGIEQNKKNIFK